MASMVESEKKFFFHRNSMITLIALIILPGRQAITRPQQPSIRDPKSVYGYR
jgi:hypothetical protein